MVKLDSYISRYRRSNNLATATPRMSSDQMPTIRRGPAFSGDLKSLKNKVLVLVSHDNICAISQFLADTLTSTVPRRS